MRKWMVLTVQNTGQWETVLNHMERQEWKLWGIYPIEHNTMGGKVATMVWYREEDA